MTANSIGQSFGRYHILEQLGEGGMAIVFRAYDTRLEKDVAIKIIRSDAFPPNQLERILKRFGREGIALEKLSHQNIIKVIDHGEHDGSPYLVMEFVPGGTLKEKLGKPIIWHEAFELLIPIAKGLAYSHKQNIIHRDVKPSNILVTNSGQLKLTDFGIAKVVENTDGQTFTTGTGVGIGTPEYMSPEQGAGRDADARADIYSLGIVLYEMLVGRKPYSADTPMAVIVKHINDPLPRPRNFVKSLPEDVERILFKALAKNPEDRYQEMSAFARAMETSLSTHKSRVERIAGSKEKRAKTLRAFRLLFTAIKNQLFNLGKQILFTRQGRISLALVSILATVIALGANILQNPEILSNRISQFTSQQNENSTIDPINLVIETNTHTLIPTQTPAPQYKKGDLLFEDDFEDGNFDDWQVYNPEHWSLATEENGNHAVQVMEPDYKNVGGNSIVNGDLTWINYSLEFDAKVIQEGEPDQIGISAFVRQDFDINNPPRSAYLIRLKKDGGEINRYSDPLQNLPMNEAWKGIGLLDYPNLRANQWYTIRIDIYNDEIWVYIDGVLAGSAKDNEPLPAGLIELHLSDEAHGGILLFDNIRIAVLVPNSPQAETPLPPTKVTTPIPALQYREEKVIFENNFETNSIEKSSITDSKGLINETMDWSIETDEYGNHYLAVSPPSGLEIQYWPLGGYLPHQIVKNNFVIEAKVNIQGNGSFLQAYSRNETQQLKSCTFSYKFDFSGGMSIYDGCKGTSLIESPTRIQRDTWHKIRIEFFNGQIREYLDGKLVNFVSAEPMTDTVLQFDTSEGQTYYDDIRIAELIENPNFTDQLIASIFDSFDNPAFDGSFNSEIWKIQFADETGFTKQQYGVLRLEQSGKDRYHTIHSKINPPTDRLMYVEAELFLDQSTNASDIEFNLRNESLFLCGIRAGNNTTFYCMEEIIENQPVNIFQNGATLGQWHTFRYVLNPLDNTVSLWIDGKLAFTKDENLILPDAAIILGIGSQSNIGTAKGMIDNVKIGYIDP